eukprot:TRINITY_DN81444_c0_g1_i1.p1 TRINITY_DN81444_c0_g1~~TRINITY_DN81444_c0_g1_i1.p1  ORF type:complete len:221 (-),score=46.83 TRINITY_DN81444_c0_g1_i1:20-649(-)
MADIGSSQDKQRVLWPDKAPKNPVLFLKPTSSYLPLNQGPIRLPASIGVVHHEVELGIVIGDRCKNVPESKALEVVAGYCVALDLTARDLQLAAKEGGLPWTVAKGYDHFTPVGKFIPKEKVKEPNNLNMFCHVNGVEKQRTNTSAMIYNVPFLISHISSIFTLEKGDLILTGTPEGVGPIEAGDTVTGGLEGIDDSEIYFDVMRESAL